MNLSKIATSILLMGILVNCTEMDCAPPPPSIQFVLFNEQGVNVSRKYASSISAYWFEGDLKTLKRTEEVTTIPRDTRSDSLIAFNSYFPSLGMGLERTFYLDIKDGNTYSVTITYENAKTSCGRIAVMRTVRWNGKVAEKISAEPRYKFVVKGN